MSCASGAHLSKKALSRLRAIAAILRASSRLDGKQHTTLNVGGIVPLAMYLVCQIDQFEKRKTIECERAFKERTHEYLCQSLGQGPAIFKHSLVSS